MAISDEESRRREESAPPVDDTRRLEGERVLASGGGRGEATPLAPGSWLGRYEVRSLLGFGGMGRVYAAHDPTLDREVAIKALAYAFHGDAAKLRRFEREARVLAALNHPNVAAIYGFEELDGSPYLVLERVDGNTLSDKLEDGVLPWREAVGIAAQIADGLAEAHAKGVIHRDLKPSNVMMTKSGRVKLVDFGLAKSTGHGEVGQDLTATVGTVIGTAPYMSPEQIRAEELDERTDVWAFGCLLYEMLAGRRAYDGGSVPEVLAAVLRDAPDYSALPKGTPAPLSWLIQRCLHQDMGARPRHLGDLRLELLDLLAEPSKSVSASLSVPRPTRGGLRSRVGAALVVVAAAAAAAGTTLLVLRSQGAKVPARSVALSLELADGLTLPHRLAAPFALAPDGSRLVVTAAETGATRLYVRPLDDPTPTVLAGTEDAWQPFFSPDGTSVGFFADRKLARVPLAGGPVVPLGDFGRNARGATWLADGTIVLAPSQTSGLLRVSEGGGRATPLTTVDVDRGERSHRWPEALPGGEAVLFTVGFEDSSYDEARLDVVSVATGERRQVLTGAAYGRYSPSGHLVFVRGGRLHAVPFDLATLAVRGAPEVVLDGVRYDPQNGSAHFALSRSGDLVYGPGLPTSADTYMAWLDPDGRLERLGDAPRVFRDPRPAPDGSRVAVVVGARAQSDLQVVDAGGTSTQVTFGLAPHRPTWSPAGHEITVGAERGGRWRLLTVADDGSAAPRTLLEERERTYPCDWAPDGHSLVFQTSAPRTGWDLRVLAVDGGGKPLGPPRPLVVTPFHEINAVVSPDGHWVAYESDEVDGLFQVYARAFPSGDRKVRLSTGGARWPSWSGDGRIAYWDSSSRRIQVAQTRERGGHLAVEAVRSPFPDDGYTSPLLSRLVISTSGGRFNAHPRDHRFLVLESSATVTTAPLSAPVLVIGWSERLKGIDRR